MAELVFFRRSEELMRISLDGRRMTVGRAATNDILVPDAAVSRQQFALERTDDTWRLHDLSGRGTEVAGTRLAQAALEDGADIGLGQWRAIFNTTDAGFAEDETRSAHLGKTVVQDAPAPDARPSPARLRVRTAFSERLVPLQRELVIGSGEGCGLQLEDPFVSTVHCKIERRDSRFLVRDLNSRNGVFLAGVRLWEAEVPFGTSLQVGNTELIIVRAERDTDQYFPFEGMVGSDAAMRKVFETIDRVAPSQAAVAIFGESGTGKELVARAIHARSPRVDRPFVPVNCGALSRELVESELFGHEKGAFTGAERMRKGAFEEADGGTLFLDEIGELPLGLQAKLLRALELGEIKRVGATRPMNVDVRLVAATNRDLRAEVKKGAFREDLYWRLCVIPIQLPPLRARRGDLKALISHFLRMYSPHGATVAISPLAERKLLEHDWPGNVRELKNTLHRSLLLRRGEVIEPGDVTFERDLEWAAKAAEVVATFDPDVDDLTRVYIVGKTQEKIDDEVFLKTCRRVGTRASFVARELGQSRGAAYRRMEKLGLTPGGEPPGDLGPDEPERSDDED